MGEWIGIAASFLSIAIVIAGVVSKFSKMEERMRINEERDKETREKNEKMFDELFNSRNKTNENLTELTVTVKMLVSNMDKQFLGINDQLNKIHEELKNK